MLPVLIKRLSLSVQVPVKASSGAACFDLQVHTAIRDSHGWSVSTGLAIALPAGYVMLIYPRSGLSTNLGLTLRNGTGVIDSDYRGEILLKFNNGVAYDLEGILKALTPGSRVAQAMILPVPEVVLQDVSELPDSVRGTGGFGSTGV